MITGVDARDIKIIALQSSPDAHPCRQWSLVCPSAAKRPVQAALVVPNGVQAAPNPPAPTAEHRLNHKMLHITQATGNLVLFTRGRRAIGRDRTSTNE